MPLWGKITSPITLGEERGSPHGRQSEDANTDEEAGEEGANAKAGASEEPKGPKGTSQTDQDDPAKPHPISRPLLPVPAWEPRFLPDVLADMVVDFADSIPMNREFVASNVTAACGSLLSDKAQLHLKEDNDWFETPNSWVINIADPSGKKSPGLETIEEALECIEGFYEQDYKPALAAYKAQMIAYEHQVSAAKKNAANGVAPLPVEPEPPVLRRAMTNNSTAEALSVIARGGPIVVLDDEASGLLSVLADPKNQSAKAFYLTGHNGNKPYKSDRITRGTTSVPRLCLSIIGNIQPEPLMRVMLGAARDGRQADGFMQRFGLMTMPDLVQNTQLVDKTADFFKQLNGMDAIKGLVTYDPLAFGAKERPSLGRKVLPHFDLSEGALALWKAEYTRLRLEEENLSLRASYRQHVGKHPKVIATVALVIHAVERHHGDISADVMERAIAAGRFYLRHAKRVYYMAAHDIYAEPARLISERIARGEIKGWITVRDVKRWNWVGCEDTASTEAILDLLEDANWILPVAVAPGAQGGRPTKRWVVNSAAGGSSK